MNVCIFSLLFINFQSVFVVSELLNFIEIKVGIDDRICKTTDLHITKFNNSEECHIASKWMGSRSQEERRWMLCEVRSKFVRCYCDLGEGNCFDFTEIMDTVYIISRDKKNGSVPITAYQHAGNSKAALENINCALNALFDSSFGLSAALRKESNSSVPHDFGFYLGQHSGFHQMGLKFDVTARLNKRELVWKMKFQRGYSSEFFFLGRESMADILAVKERLIGQLNSDSPLFICEIDKQEMCSLKNAKNHLEKLPSLLLEYAKKRGYILENKEIDFQNLSKMLKFRVGAHAKKPEERIGIIILLWVYVAILLLIILLVIRSVANCEVIEERKPLKSELFKLKDVEEILLANFRKKSKEKSMMTIQAANELEKATKEDRIKRKRKKSVVFRSANLPTPREESDLESVKKKSRSSKVLQKTQSDITEYGTAIEAPIPRRTRPSYEPSVPSKTDLASSLNKKGSEGEVTAPKTVQKTQSDSEVEITAPAPDMPAVEPSRAKTPTPTKNGSAECKKFDRSLKNAGTAELTKGSAEKKNWKRFFW